MHMLVSKGITANVYFTTRLRQLSEGINENAMELFVARSLSDLEIQLA